MNLAKLKNDELSRSHLQYIQSVEDGQRHLKLWAEGFKKRWEAQIAPIKSESDSRQDAILVTYLEWELVQIGEITRLLETFTPYGNEEALQLRDGLSKLENADFTIQIVYESGFEELASRSREVLIKQGYNVLDITHWFDFREDGDGPMSRFFNDGPVIWYSTEHSRTYNKVEDVKALLTDVFPPNMILRHGNTVQVPGIVWYPPGPYHFQVWIFQKR